MDASLYYNAIPNAIGNMLLSNYTLYKDLIFYLCNLIFYKNYIHSY